MNQHALGVLEFDAALALVAGHASSALGAERVRELRPVSERAAIEREHARVSVMRSIVDGDAAWHPQPLVDVRSALSRLRVEGASLSAAELLGVRNILRSSRLSAESLRDERIPAVTIAMLRSEVDALMGVARRADAIRAEPAARCRRQVAFQWQGEHRRITSQQE
jgi:dsDNA-specific endonuclease/ATPase MutS2